MRARIRRWDGISAEIKKKQIKKKNSKAFCTIPCFLVLLFDHKDLRTRIIDYWISFYYIAISYTLSGVFFTWWATLLHRARHSFSVLACMCVCLSNHNPCHLRSVGVQTCTHKYKWFKDLQWIHRQERHEYWAPAARSIYQRAWFNKLDKKLNYNRLNEPFTRILELLTRKMKTKILEKWNQ